MCVGIPMRICAVDQGFAWCDRDGEQVKINTMLVGDLPVDTWVLTFQDSAIRTMSEEEAQQCKAALTALGMAMAGDTSQIDTLFADLVNREPQLPEHLRPASQKTE